MCFLVEQKAQTVILAGDINAQVGRLSPTENQLGGPFALNSRRNDNGDRLLHICASRHLFFISTAFRRTGRRTVTCVLQIPCNLGPR